MITEHAIVPGSTRRLAVEECRPELQQLYFLWQKLRGIRLMPARRDFDPAQVPRLLPDIFLVDVLASNPPERRYRVRLQGTAQVDYYGADWTGSYIHQMIDRGSADRFCAIGDHLVSTRAPWTSTGKLYWLPEKPFYRFETVLLPLSDDGIAVNMVLGLTRLF
ncbi:MAG TPA: PAS domain-containing protein [Aliidongia sp.]|uniref:PAS domain-containing protein n=1 Tax=Aliidongia sp. TaxID=1914230 RepID=UPI002DDCF1ED|nr:PAS domain-containing protein [Aliidongia sp.]HEV2675073.1 PAS domain-containing protein [Aliidongia sp.]